MGKKEEIDLGRGEAINLIAAERQRQLEDEGWLEEHDDTHDSGELALAAASYALPPDYPGRDPIYGSPDSWPWLEFWWKPSPNDRIRELVKAGALIVAEIDRLQRDIRALDDIKTLEELADVMGPEPTDVLAVPASSDE